MDGLCRLTRRVTVTDANELQELNERLNLIEGMIAEGRRTTARWGWSLLLWGVAYYIAGGWTYWGHRPEIAWPVTMSAAAVVSGIAGSRAARKSGRQTTIGRSMMAIWCSMAASLFLFGFGIGLSRHWNPYVVLAANETILGMTYMASSIILRWKMQFVCALVWWATAVVSLFGTIQQGFAGFLVGTFLCMIVFGIYAMVREGSCQGNVSHA